MCRGDADGAAEMKTMMRDNPDKFRMLMRACRIKAKGEPDTLPGVNTEDQQMEKVRQMFAEFHVEFQRSHGQRAIGTLMNLTEKQFLAHRQYREGDTREEAQQLWDHHVTTGRAMINWKRPDQRIIVSDIPKIEGYTDQNESRMVRCPMMAIESADDMARVQDQMSFNNFDLSTELSQKFTGGEYFLEGNHVGSSSSAIPVMRDVGGATSSVLPALEDIVDPLGLQRTVNDENLQAIEAGGDGANGIDFGEDGHPELVPAKLFRRSALRACRCICLYILLVCMVIIHLLLDICIDMYI